jgi:hypothetical protein
MVGNPCQGTDSHLARSVRVAILGWYLGAISNLLVNRTLVDEVYPNASSGRIAQ